MIVGKGYGFFYSIRISKNCCNLEKNQIYDIDYLLVTIVNETAYNKILKEDNFEKNLETIFELISRRLKI